MLFWRFASIMKFAVNPTARRHFNPSEIRVDKFLDTRDLLIRGTG
jgi:hypothetical protein